MCNKYLQQADDLLTHVRREVLETGGHVRHRGQRVRVQIAVLKRAGATRKVTRHRTGQGQPKSRSSLLLYNLAQGLESFPCILKQYP